MNCFVKFFISIRFNFWCDLSVLDSIVLKWLWSDLFWDIDDIEYL